MKRWLIGLGLLCLVLGMGWPWLKEFPLGRLPGDITVVRGNLRFYLPLTSSILVSGVVSLILWLLNR
ncbi:DUF2905 domain-containing protein [Desulfogranum mediterraneum]|uniref:DUF2905 domain-containing protein n=1 Tax=Desulfogranum mediterraneum TaxID=160661 RepID=UPI0004272A1C|nr:DUF2905 domain-containing protein [Desulfogranum mediterraneum]